MHVIEATTIIEAPIDQVFAIDSDPRRMPEYVKSVVKMTPAEGSGEPAPGASYAIAYGVPGMSFEGTLTIAELAHNSQIKFTSGGKSGTATQTNTFRDLGDGRTEVHWLLEFAPATGLLGKALGFAMKLELTPKSFARDLDSLKQLCEGK